MIRTALSLFALLALACGVAHAGGDATAGKAKAGLCVACHGVDGNSMTPIWPSLAGQHESYLAKQITAFQEGVTRNNLVMAPMIAGLSAQDIDDVSAYFAALPRRGMMSDESTKDVVAQGERLYRGGNKETGIAACMGCHGPDGSGNELAGFPSLGNQQPEYTATQLKAFRSGARSNDLNAMMRDIAARLTDDEIAAVSAYLTGLN
jgi:cytochrome c553